MIENMSNNKSEKNLKILLKIFFLWLLLQFFLQTFVTFELWLDGGIWTIIRAWKEVLLLWFVIIIGWRLLKQKKMKSFLENFPIKKFLILFITTLIIILIVTLLFTQSSLGIVIMSLRYTFSGFFIFILIFALSRLFFKWKEEKVLVRYEKIMKSLLVLAIFRWIMIWIVPKTLDFFGYNMYAFEWDVGVEPPSVYYTQLDHWFVRNQFLFERPISRWFFLIALRPLFFVFMVKNKSAKNIFLRWGIYGFNIFLTFSRAAWWARIILTFILLLLEYRKQFWKLSIYLFLPLLALFTVAAFLWKDQIISREYSNTWHKKLLLQAVDMIKEKPFFGQWAWTAGPVTHHRNDIEEYNPENQFLQIWIEYWVFGFIWWMWMFIWLILRWFTARKVINSKKTTKQQKHSAWILLAVSLWLLWLAIEWLVLHSFVDRMIVYPFMAIFALAYSNFLYNNPRTLNTIK